LCGVGLQSRIGAASRVRARTSVAFRVLVRPALRAENEPIGFPL
jgi:hypothetical protein